MSREILFKAKRANWRRLPKEDWWVEGNLAWSNDSFEEYRAIIIPKENSNMFLDSEENDLGFEVWHIVDPETVCQYTGLTDINKNKIWESDIVFAEHTRYEKESKEDYMLLPETVEYTRNYAIEFVNKGSHCGYRCRNKSIHFAISGNTIYNHKIAVIGNIFDNPELLKDGQQPESPIT